MYEIDKFNQTFEKIRDIIHRIGAVYEDLYTLFDYYFNDKNFCVLEEGIYKDIISLLK